VRACPCVCSKVVTSSSAHKQGTTIEGCLFPCPMASAFLLTAGARGRQQGGPTPGEGCQPAPGGPGGSPARAAAAWLGEEWFFRHAWENGRHNQLGVVTGSAEQAEVGECNRRHR